MSMTTLQIRRTFWKKNRDVSTVTLGLLLYKAKMQYLLSCKVGRYCLSTAEHQVHSGRCSSPVIVVPFFTHMPLCKDKRQYLLTCKVSRYCLLALHGSIHAPGSPTPSRSPRKHLWTFVETNGPLFYRLECGHARARACRAHGFLLLESREFHSRPID